MNEHRNARSGPVPQEDAMHILDTDVAFQLASDRRQRLLDQATRRRRLRRRPVDAALPGTPRDAA